MAEEKILSTELLYNGRTLKLRVDTIKLPTGRKTIREIVEHSDSVAIIAIDNNNSVLLVKQFREAIGKELLEIPAGGIDPGEDPMDTARRELQEETAYLPKKLAKLGGFYSTPGFCNEYLHLYLATDLTPSQLYADDTEGIILTRVPVSHIHRLITSGTICDGKSIAGLLIFLDYQKSAKNTR